MHIIVGAQWGDEGKGKIVDYLAQEADWIVRYQGGNNAGHTVIIDDQTYKLHLVPSGILQKKRCILGNGVVLHPVALHQEMLALHDRGIETQNLFFISSRAHLILEQHLQADQNQEAQRSQKVGTTGKGIGPAYMQKIERSGVRAGSWRGAELTALETEALTFLEPYICDTTALLHAALDNQDSILLEGAQGTFLDIDHGTYPFVTSSNCTAGGACTGSGLPPGAVKQVTGILKAYTTRVGNGPFPTELEDQIGQQLQRQGQEFGTTTGRTRRCGWLDLVMADYARRINGINQWALMKLDVLSGLDEIKICTGYRYQGKLLASYPADINVLSEVEPVYESCAGWSEDLTQCKRREDLPEAVQTYLQRIEKLTKTPIRHISVGPERKQTMHG